MRLAIRLSSMLVLVLGSTASAQVPADDWRADVDAFARRLVEAGLVPGMGLAVVLGDSIVHDAGFGVADRETGRPVDPETSFYIASSTKALTATAVVLLAERGEIDLTDPVSRYLPNLALEPPLAAVHFDDASGQGERALALAFDDGTAHELREFAAVVHERGIAARHHVRAREDDIA